MIDHVPLAFMVTTAEDTADVGFQELVLRLSVGGWACWVTVIVRFGAPGAVTVIVPLLDCVLGFGNVVSLKEPLPVRFAGVMFSTLTQPRLPSLTVHCALEVTWIVVLLALNDDVHEPVDRFRVAEFNGMMPKATESSTFISLPLP